MSLLTPYAVQRLRGGYAIVWFDDDKRHRQKLFSKERSSAEAEARQLWAAADVSPWTVGRIVTGYIADLARRDPPSLRRRKEAWKAMSLFWEHVEPSLIDEDMCQAYRSTRSVSDVTARYELQLLSTALIWGKGKAGYEEKPSVWLPAKSERKVRHLSHEEFDEFYKVVMAPHARLYVLLALYTMARPAAILDLTWDQIDFRLRQINLNPPGRRQTAKRRPIVAMNDALFETMSEAYEARQTKFVIERGGRRIDSIKKAFQAASERCGFRVTPYMLRHTGAVWAAEAGVSMPELAQYMGHDDDRTTQKHYARFSPGHLKNVANAVRRKAKEDG